MEVLSRKALLTWIILLQLLKKEADSETITTNIPNELSLFTNTSSLKTQVSNLLISLELKNYVMKFSYGRMTLYRLTPKGEHFLKQPLNNWQMTLERQVISLEKMLEACRRLQSPSNKINLSYEESLFLTQNIEAKSILSSLSLIELEERKKLLGSNEHPISLVELQKVLKQTYGWICSSTTFNNYIKNLVEANYLQLKWKKEEPNKKIRVISIEEKGEGAIVDLANNAKREVKTALTVFQEIRDFLSHKKHQYI
ncbi:hypothetical protein [Halalkalibacter okhensis]|uniref:Uncharacterized protein n=1 Tax=Halalkalibacter okhensis TaxID=333138 RepID=A0A0B0IIX5_9BACI|nr:hypothetical protein [Halalkalibacter okhensis]KHF39626.1 hypothetical protein LQ50_14435 [Halalkalibacter okhensis]